MPRPHTKELFPMLHNNLTTKLSMVFLKTSKDSIQGCPKNLEIANKASQIRWPCQ